MSQTVKRFKYLHIHFKAPRLALIEPLKTLFPKFTYLEVFFKEKIPSRPWLHIILMCCDVCQCWSSSVLTSLCCSRRLLVSSLSRRYCSSSSCSLGSRRTEKDTQRMKPQKKKIKSVKYIHKTNPTQSSIHLNTHSLIKYICLHIHPSTHPSIHPIVHLSISHPHLSYTHSLPHKHTYTNYCLRLALLSLLALPLPLLPISPLVHLVLHVNALFIQQLPLSEGPVHRLHGGLSAGRAFPLLTRLLRVVEAEHVALTQNDAVSCIKSKKPAQNRCTTLR